MAEEDQDRRGAAASGQSFHNLPGSKRVEYIRRVENGLLEFLVPGAPQPGEECRPKAESLSCIDAFPRLRILVSHAKVSEYLWIDGRKLSSFMSMLVHKLSVKVSITQAWAGLRSLSSLAYARIRSLESFLAPGQSICTGYKKPPIKKLFTPKGPVYVAIAREVLAEEIRPYSLDQEQWVPIGPSALPDDAIHDISTALVQAERPLIITGYSGRDRRTPELLVALTDLIPGIRVHDTGGSDMCFPFSHIASEGFRLSFDECTRDTDMIFLLDCDVPWIPSRNPPPKNTKIYHVDCDPLNQQIPVSFFPAHGRWKADSFTALRQLVNYIKGDASLKKTLQDPKYTARGNSRGEVHKARLANIASQPRLGDQERLDAHNIGSLLKRSLPDSTTFVIEAVTAAQTLSDQLQPSRPGSWINCGGTGIGWSNGAALGVKMALANLGEGCQQSLVCHIVGDGSFMCAAPSSALWVASKYEILILTIVLNNGGWKAPRNSAELVYPTGLSTSASDDEINISFRPTPNYAALAEAAAGSDVGWGNTSANAEVWIKGMRARTVGDFKEALQHANSRVVKEGKGMLIEALM
ncbi:hypothetical protein DL768_009186 [Monosporascus sp. mg162]|nr:hypothetical protein DL768_009186 [Monosporascus sp. mg162]